MHVATLIYYLGYARQLIVQDPNNIKYPATHLSSIFVDVESSERANAPRYIRHKRRNMVSLSENQVESSSASSSEISDDEIDNDQSFILDKLINQKMQTEISKNGTLATNKNLLSTDNKIETSSKLNSDVRIKTVQTDMREFNGHIPTNGGFLRKNNDFNLFLISNIFYKHKKLS